MSTPLYLVFCLFACVSLAAANNRVAIRTRIRKSGQETFVQKHCTKLEQKIVMQSMFRALVFHSVDPNKELADPWWCEAMCRPYKSENCMIFHPDCSNLHNTIKVNETRRLDLVVNKLLEVHEDHGDNQLQTQCRASRATVLSRIRNNIGDKISGSCKSYLSKHIHVSCFVVRADELERQKTQSRVGGEYVLPTREQIPTGRLFN